MFDCPRCLTEDILYDEMPKRCYQCGGEHNFDIFLLVKKAQEGARANYHFTGKTSR